MNDYVELRLDITPCSETATDILAALLCDCGYESFLPDDKGLTAYIRREDYGPDDVTTVIESLPIPATVSTHAIMVEGKDWNAEWEKNYFKPIVVGDRCVIHSSFHTDIPAAEYDIVIDPKMAFGTGHHSTTSLIIAQLLDTDLRGLKVVDMGTGTGILAILAAMRGASPVIGIEIDPAARLNADENIRLNNRTDVRIILGDASALSLIDGVDLFIANINRNIITADLGAYASTMRQGASMLLSGFFVDDIPVITAAARTHGLSYVSHTAHDNWACVKLIKD
ncbi:MAG: 50S ribosomal protein L11 methyltransferase [Pseudoflavonifractor sp.]|nr:50S ribosomal protein L11 methyltransferase [Pseudoflavonifractor sp.]